MRPLVLLAAGIAALATGVFSLSSSAAPPWGPESPPFNLEVILRDNTGGNGFGHVTFRQPNDEARVIYLDTWLRGLQPNRAYLLQRQVDLRADGDCADSSLSSWLTLSEGFALPPTPVVTDDRGTGRASLFRDLDPPGPLTGPPPGTRFDIRFRVVDAISLAPVLESECYVYAVSM
jgi:hypothetical protein